MYINKVANHRSVADGLDEETYEGIRFESGLFENDCYTDQPSDSPYSQPLDVHKYMSHPSNINILHFNIQSLKSNVDGLQELLHNFKSSGVIPPSLLLLCETNLSDLSNKMYNLPGYKRYELHRSSKKAVEWRSSTLLTLIAYTERISQNL